MNSNLNGICERIEAGLLILSPNGRKPFRRVLFTNISGGPKAWQKVREGLMPSNRFWGCKELVGLGYEVAIAEPLPDFYWHRKALPHDLRYFNFVRSWLGRDGILYCAHNVLYWLPLLKALGAVQCKVVSLLYAREPLAFAKAHSGIIGLNPAAAEHAKKLAPQAKVAHLGWGVDLPFYPKQAYKPQWFLSCGRTNRDDATLSLAASKVQSCIRVINHQGNSDIQWPQNVNLEQGGGDWEKRVSYDALQRDYYGGASGSLMIVKDDPTEYTACGFTGLIESMALGKPVILTRTSALKTEIDVEKQGCGLHVPPTSPESLAEAIQTLANDPRRAQAMGEQGRRLCENHYNIERFAKDLHHFFEAL